MPDQYVPAEDYEQLKEAAHRLSTYAAVLFIVDTDEPPTREYMLGLEKRIEAVQQLCPDMPGSMRIDPSALPSNQQDVEDDDDDEDVDVDEDLDEERNPYVYYDEDEDLDEEE